MFSNQVFYMLIHDSGIFHDPIMCDDLAFDNQNSREYAFFSNIFVSPPIHTWKLIVFLPPCLINAYFFNNEKDSLSFIHVSSFQTHPNEGTVHETWWMLWKREAVLNVIMKYSTPKGFI